MPPRLFPEERHQQILTFLEQKGRVSVQELSDAFGLTPATIRADLETLAAQGRLQRTHGGAIPSGRAAETDLSFDVRRRMNVAEKERIGEAAAAMVSDGEAIILDASTTSLAIARHLHARRELTVVTNSLSVANDLTVAFGVTVLMPGGFLRRDSLSLVSSPNPETPGLDAFFKGYHLQKAFVGAKGFSLEKGLTDANSLEVNAKRALIGLADQLIAVVDGSKWGQVSFAAFAEIEQLSMVITGASAPAEQVGWLRERGIKVIVA